jgi:hypothetical protein
MIFHLKGIHELLHLVECTREFGPLNSVSCFQFEELNRKLTTYIKGYDLIGEEFLKLFSAVQRLASTDKILNKEFREFIVSKNPFKTSNKKNLSKLNKNIKCSAKCILDASKLELINNVLGTCEREYYSKCTFHGIVYESFSNRMSKRFCDACITTRSGKIGLIVCFISQLDQILVLIKHLVVINRSFYEKHPFIQSSLNDCLLSNQFSIVDIKEISKIVLIHIKADEADKEDKYYTSNFDSSHLFT